MISALLQAYLSISWLFYNKAKYVKSNPPDFSLIIVQEENYAVCMLTGSFVMKQRKSLYLYQMWCQVKFGRHIMESKNKKKKNSSYVSWRKVLKQT